MKKLLLLAGAVGIFFAGAFAQKEKNVLSGTKNTFDKAKEKGAELCNKVKDGLKDFLKKEEKVAEEVAEEVKETVEEVKEAVEPEKSADSE